MMGGYMNGREIVCARTMCLALCTALSAWCAAAQSDAARNHSSEMNAGPAARADRQADGGVKVLFLGNSITLHQPCPPIGWTNNWGMAASAPERDYVHIVTRGIERQTGRKADVRVRSLYRFEKSFASWKGADEMASDIAFAPDYLIVALGENVDELPSGQPRLDFEAAFTRMLGCYFASGRHPRTVVRGVFWPNAWKDHAMAQAAKAYSVPFVATGDLGCDDTMRALGNFWHQGVQAHPGDLGMAKTAERILGALFPHEKAVSQNKKEQQ